MTVEVPWKNKTEKKQKAESGFYFSFHPCKRKKETIKFKSNH